MVPCNVIIRNKKDAKKYKHLTISEKQSFHQQIKDRKKSYLEKSKKSTATRKAKKRKRTSSGNSNNGSGSSNNRTETEAEFKEFDNILNTIDLTDYDPSTSFAWLPAIAGNDQIGIKIVTNYIYIYRRKSDGKVVYVGVVCRWTGGYGPRLRDAEHKRDLSTTFDSWYDGTNAVMKVVDSKEFYVQYNIESKKRCKKDMQKLRNYRKLMEQSYVSHYKTMIADGGYNSVNPNRLRMKVAIEGPNMILQGNGVVIV